MAFSKFPSFSLEGECAVITGGATGLGYGIAGCFVAAGAKVVLAGRREEELHSAAATLGPKATYARHDVTEHERSEAFLSTVTERAGTPPTILINNAGIHLKKPVVDTGVSEFASVLNTHVLGAHALARAFLPGMMERGHGNIVSSPPWLPFSAFRW